MAIPSGNSNCNACSCKKSRFASAKGPPALSLHVFFPEIRVSLYRCVCGGGSLGACNKAWADLQLICKKKREKKGFVLE